VLIIDRQCSTPFFISCRHYLFQTITNTNHNIIIIIIIIIRMKMFMVLSSDDVSTLKMYLSTSTKYSSINVL